MEQLTITQKNGNNYILFEMKGAFNAYTAAEAQTKIYDAIKTQNVVLDLSEIIELDSSAIGIIMAAFNDGEESGFTLYLMSVSNEADKAITATGFRDSFKIINSVTEVA